MSGPGTRAPDGRAPPPSSTGVTLTRSSAVGISFPRPSSGGRGGGPAAARARLRREEAHPARPAGRWRCPRTGTGNGHGAAPGWRRKVGRCSPHGSPRGAPGRERGTGTARLRVRREVGRCSPDGHRRWRDGPRAGDRLRSRTRRGWHGHPRAGQRVRRNRRTWATRRSRDARSPQAGPPGAARGAGGGYPGIPATAMPSPVGPAAGTADHGGPVRSGCCSCWAGSWSCSASRPRRWPATRCTSWRASTGSTTSTPPRRRPASRRTS